VQQIAKDPYVFDFFDLIDRAAERDLEQALMDRIVDTIPAGKRFRVRRTVGTFRRRPSGS